MTMISAAFTVVRSVKLTRRVTCEFTRESDYVSTRSITY